MSGKGILKLVIPLPDSGQQPPPCTKVPDPELFFPTSYSDDYRHQIEEAKAVCRNCPMKFACLEFALDTGDQHAILGGTTPAERTVIHQKRAAIAERAEKRKRKYQKWSVDAA